MIFSSRLKNTNCKGTSTACVTSPTQHPASTSLPAEMSQVTNGSLEVRVDEVPDEPVVRCEIIPEAVLIDFSRKIQQFDWDYKWYLDECPVPICTANSYTPHQADVGSIVSVECTPLCQITKNHLCPPGRRQTRELLQFPELHERKALMFRTMKSPNFKVVTYNLLAKKFFNPKKFRNCPAFAGNWTYRRQLILTELATYDADILSLQEMQCQDFKLFFEPHLKRKGYAGVFESKGRESPFVDGCAIFFKLSTFTLVEPPIRLSYGEKAREIFPDELVKYNSVHVAILLKLQLTDDSREYIVVGNTHLKPETHTDDHNDRKMFQVLCLLEELAKLSKNTSPIILCGDFNFTNESVIYEVIMDKSTRTQISCGRLLSQELQMNSAYKALSEADANLPKVEYQKSLLIGGEPPFTHYNTNRAIDFIFFTADKLECGGVLPLASNMRVQMPSAQWPSDHAALMGFFYFKKNVELRIWPDMSSAGTSYFICIISLVRGSAS